ncbi:MAG TPA: DUF3108 domain-containing protein, partial [Caldithrix sp.]|nr:DUF3108 domain-containing protein [Caldithrix sp.]
FVSYPVNVVYSGDTGYKWYPGEELIYNVSWTYIHLGKLKVQVFENKSNEIEGKYYCRLFVDSNPLLFFVNMHSMFESYVSEDFKPYLHQAYENVDGVNYFTQHYFNYADSTIKLKMTSVKDSLKVIERIYPLVDKYYDAISLVYLTRAMIDRVQSDTLKSFFGEDIGDVAISYHGVQDEIFSDYKEQYDAMYFVDGTFLMKGVAGLTGPYKGWFVGSERRIPAKAELKVFLGNVIVELESVNQITDMSYDVAKYKKD